MISHPVEGIEHCVAGHAPLFAGRWEDIGTSARECAEFAQHCDSLARQWYQVLKSHFHAFGGNAPLDGFPIKVLQFVPFSSAQFGRSKKCQGYELQRKFGLPLTAVRLQFLQECYEPLESHSPVTLRFTCRLKKVLDLYDCNTLLSP